MLGAGHRVRDRVPDLQTVLLTDGQVIEIHNPIDMPDVVKIAEIEESLMV